MSRRYALRAVSAVIVLALANWWVATIGHEPSAAMEPTVGAGDFTLVDKLTHRIAGLGYGDVVRVQLERPFDVGTTTHTRRVLGLPGDRMSCRDGSLHRDGRRVSEPYLRPGTSTDCEPLTVPAGRLYLLGDNRPVSQDSRQGGTFATSAVVGRVRLLSGPG